ncbi:MAG: hypothetical protein ACRCS8_02065 [Brevinema sp.]
MILYPLRDVPIKLKSKTFYDELPGVVQSISISGELDTSSENKSYTIHAYKQKRISVDLLLLPFYEVLLFDRKQSVFRQLKKLEEIFSKQKLNPDSPTEVVIFEVIHPHFNKRGVTRVILESMTSYEDADQSTIRVSLVFVAMDEKGGSLDRTNIDN